MPPEGNNAIVAQLLKKAYQVGFGGTFCKFEGKLLYDLPQRLADKVGKFVCLYLFDQFI